MNPVVIGVAVDASGLLRLLAGGVAALLTSLCCGPFVIRVLQRRAAERIDSASATLNELHAAKQKTPTMGGLLIAAAVVTGCAAASRALNPVVLVGLLTFLTLASVGFVDDWLKIHTLRRGLTVRRKLLCQLLTGVVSAGLLWSLEQSDSQGVMNSTDSESLPGLLRSSPVVFVPWATLVIVATSNAVNLTDGLDGLASGCTVLAALALPAAAILGPADAVSAARTLEAGCLSAALAGATLGFLWFNRHPARVFMGDTGALAVGGLLAVIALLLREELLLLLIGGVFVVETLSVIAQVVWFRRTGQRLLRCSPLHNHFVFGRVPETRIVASFHVAAALLAAIAVGWALLTR
jgi:phospho-N-acetylmuramoyl-pentapeptide-transferase